MPQTLPIVVSFYTPDPPYQEYAERFRATTPVRTGLRTIVALSPPGYDWVCVTCRKATFILSQMMEHECPIVWLDIDAEVISCPRLLLKPKEDFAVWAEPAMRPRRFIGREERLWMPRGWPMHVTPRWFKSGTLYFAYTDRAMELLVEWVRLCKEEPRGYDQYLLQTAWAKIQPATLWLPRTYCWIRKMYRQSKADTPVIMQDLASCEHKVVRS